MGSKYGPLLLGPYPPLPFLGGVGSMGPCLEKGIEWVGKDSD